MYKKIIVATDLSEISHKTLHRATEMAKLCQAQLVMVHVVEPLPAYAMGYFGSVNVEQELLEEAKKNLADLGKEFNIAAADQLVEMGSIKTSILNVAKEKQADLIIVGSHGRHGLELLLGSTAQAILHGAEIDVLVVRIED